MKLTKGSKVWLWFALILCIFTTVINITSGRWPSVILAIISIAGLCMILFTQNPKGFYLVCICYGLSFIAGVAEGISGGTGILTAVAMSLIGSVLVPGITWLFIRKELKSGN